jgi:WD40 repeat protein
MRLGALKQLRQLDASLSKMGDQSLTSFAGCDNLRVLTLRGVQAGRSPIAGFDKLPLESFQIHFGPVTDDFLACLPYQRLATFSLLGCKEVSDGGLKHFQAAKRLEYLTLQGTRVTDTGLAYLAQLRQLRTLLLGDTRISSAGLTSLSGLKELEVLDLSKTLVGSDLSALAGLNRLCWLRLNDTQIADESLVQLAGLSDLDHLDLRATAVTAEGVAWLQSALPQCLIVTDFPQLPVSATPPTAPVVPASPPKMAASAVAAPMSISALVGRPARLKGLKSWTIDTRQHRNAIHDFAISPDNSLLATAAADGNVRVWDVHSHQLRKVFFGDANRFRVANWSPDGKKLAAAHDGASVFVWNVESGRVERTLSWFNCGLARLAWTPDSNALALGGGDGHGVAIWDIASDHLRLQLPDRTGICAWSPKGDRLAVDSAKGNGGIVVVSDARTGEERASFQAAESGLAALAWSPDAKFLAVAGENSPEVRILAADTGQSVQVLANPSGSPITDLAWSPQGDRFATVSGGLWASGELRFWDATTWQPLGSAAPAHFRLKWSDDGRTIAALADQGVSLFNVGERQLTSRFSVLQGTGYLLHSHLTHRFFAWSGDGEQLALRSGPTSIGVWDGTTGSMLHSFKTKPQHRWWEGMAWSHDARMLVKSSFDGPLECFDIVSGKPPKELPFSWHSLDFSPNDRLLAGIGSNGRVQICDVSSGNAVGIPFGTGVELLAWSPRGDQIAMREELTLFVRRADSGEAVAQFDERTGQITALAWSPDGEQLAIGDLDGSAIFLWHPTTATKRVIGVPARLVNSLAFSADGQTLIVAQADNMLRTFDVQSLDLLSTVPFATGLGLAFSPDLARAASLDGGMALRFCDVSQGSTSGVIMPFSENEWMAIGADGHYRGTPGIEKHLIYVAESNDGEQLILSPAEFSKQFGWQNDPALVQLTSAPKPIEPNAVTKPAAPAKIAQGDTNAFSWIICGAFMAEER